MMNRHLHELRTRAIKCSLAYILVFIVCFYFSDKLYDLLASLINTPLIATKITSTLMVPIQLCMFTALLICMPYLLFNIWAFVRPAMYSHERKYISFWLGGSCILFYIGIIFSLYIIAPVAIKFFTNIVPTRVTMMVDIENYLDFITTLAIACGIAFQTPLLTLFLLRSKLISLAQINYIRPYVIVLVFVLGMLLTPPDVISQILLALPMWGLFELGIIIHKYSYN